MASALNAALCALVASGFWTFLGVALGRLVLPDRWLVWPLAPTLGWAVFNAAALPVFLLAGFSRTSLAVVAGFAIVAALAVLARRPPAAGPAAAPGPPPLAYLGAGLLALIPAAAVVPKIGALGVGVAVPIFDHAKIAIIDAMVRLGLPMVNPVFGPASGEIGHPAHVSYYYLWHFSAAVAALTSGVSGWEADIAVTWFTAFAWLALAMGLAVWLCGRRVAAWWVLILAPVGSLRPVLETLFGADFLDGLLRPAAGLEGWLFQASWSPQHVQSAGCAVLALVLVAGLCRRPGGVLPAVLALVVAAGFQSSLWVGGVVVPLAAAATAAVLLSQREWPERRRFAVTALAAGLGAVLLSLPLLIDQYQAAQWRAVTSPVGVAPMAVLSTLVPEGVRRLLDLPAFWTVFLLVQFPALYPLGALALARRGGFGGSDSEPSAGVTALAVLGVTSLLVSWLLVSRIGENNDLGWRAILPGLLVLTAIGAAFLASRGLRWRSGVGIAVATLIVLGLPHTAELALYNAIGLQRPASEAGFARSQALWAAVRRHTGPAERVANNPLFLGELTLWPVNLSWALLSDRSSCFAGRELALAFAPLPTERREAIHAQFVRVFAGDATPEDLTDLARRYDCRVAVVTVEDGAWLRDPFAASPLYRLVERSDGQWRVYRLRDVGTRLRDDGPGPAG
ncbi:MAG: hypothetical protein GC191_09945 [Azospirillum sp.]|nr:hypothetical protein [Azospirillum sp.]